MLPLLEAGMTADFSTQMMKARKWRDNIFKLLSENNCQSIIPYSARISFENKGKDVFRKTKADRAEILHFIQTKWSQREIWSVERDKKPWKGNYRVNLR